MTGRGERRRSHGIPTTQGARGAPRALTELGEGVRIAFSALAGHRLRSALTTLGIVIGVMTVIAIVAIIQGLNQSFEAQIQNFGAHTVYVAKHPFVSVDEEWWSSATAGTLAAASSRRSSASRASRWRSRR